MASNRWVGVIGLGLMGTAISERLLERGYRVQVWNRTREKALPLIDRGAVWSDEPIADCDRVIISLYDSDAVAEVLNGMQGRLHTGQYLVDTTTGAPEQSMQLERQLAEQGVHYMDAPISGSSEQIRRGEAVVMVGGEKPAFNACADLWPVLGNRVYHTGSCGSASKMKLITNLVLGLNRLALAEGLTFTQAIGIDPAAALEVLKGSAASSRVMDVKGRKMIEEDFTVQARLAQHLKDVRLMLEAAGAVGLSLPMSRMHCQLLEQAVGDGLGDLDNSAIIQVLGKPVVA